MHAYVAGIAPRSQGYMRRHWDHAKGFIDDDSLETARAAERQQWVEAQEAAGLDLLGPSYVETEDVLRPLTELAGARAGPLTRTFETNTFHRRPEIDVPVPADGLRRWVERTALPADWVVNLPSPYDAVVRSHIADEDVERSVAVCLNEAARHALSLGARLVRFAEPSAGYRRHDVDVERLRQLLETATSGIRAASVVHFTQVDVLAHPELVDAVPCRGIGLDVAWAEGDGDLAGKQLHAGVIDGQSSLVEEPAPPIELADRTGARLWAVTNGWDLEHVPFDVAVRKLEALGRARLLEVAA